MYEDQEVVNGKKLDGMYDNANIINGNQYAEMYSNQEIVNGNSSNGMYDDQVITNPDDRTLYFGESSDYKTSAIRIDDSDISIRKSWSSSKIHDYAHPSDQQLISEYVDQYGEFYFSDYDETVYGDWTTIVTDAEEAINNGELFYVAWSEKRIAEVVSASTDSEPRMTVLINGLAFAMSDVGIFEVPLYSVVQQYDGTARFPQNGTSDRLYIDTSSDMLYYWNGDYHPIKSAYVALHKLTFGADQEFVYDGSQDVTVPVYKGDIT